MILGCAFLGSINVLVKFLSGRVHPFEIAFFRTAGQLVFMLPWLFRRGFRVMRTERLGAHLARAVTGLSAMLSWFTVLSIMPVTEVTALSFTAPLFATVGAALLLGETVRLRRWSATGMGFIGALIILRPGVMEFTWASGLVLVAAALIATSALMVKSLSRTETPNAMVLYMALFMTPMSLVPALFVWETPDLDTFLWLVVLGGIATLAHLCINRAFAAADASAVMPFDFVRLPVAAGLAFVFFGELADLWTWIGAGVIFTSSFYIARRELLLNRETSIAPSPAIAVIGEEGGPAAMAAGTGKPEARAPKE